MAKRRESVRDRIRKHDDGDRSLSPLSRGHHASYPCRRGGRKLEEKERARWCNRKSIRGAQDPDRLAIRSGSDVNYIGLGSLFVTRYDFRIVFGSCFGLPG
ncbi:hypothetical protein PIB30_006193 [Stylosanthes scabra]|uniref:Uncharacterized protein n=1 Tax=Stylosanthes scabra TaxID=79078 RepID=A0ABU6Y2A8_9FABA|nr:hypothetical protein [Stylosanthes scabra]